MQVERQHVSLTTSLEPSLDPGVVFTRSRALIGPLLPASMQLTYKKLEAQLRQNSRLRRLAAVLLATYALKKLSPYLWRKLQVRHTWRICYVMTGATSAQ